MRVSRKFLEDYLDIKDISSEQIANDMTSIGNEYSECSKMVQATNLVIGKVLECLPHPDSNHLHVCKVDIKSQILNIVCGAPNVREGLKVIVAKVGAVLPNITIKESSIRGVKSEGMLCSIAELGIPNKYLEPRDIEGICELGDDAIVGDDPIKYLNLDDEIIDFELTSNRGDLLSIYGMAYEIGAIYNKKVKKMEIDFPKSNVDDEINLSVETKKCPFFLGRIVKNIKISESPDFIKKRLMASGIRPINNVVDISNYVMLETGQPLHFYDANTLGDTLIVRDAKDDEKIVTLDNIERTLSSFDIVIANKDGAVALAGVMGGLNSEVTENTKDILIESAIFDNVSVRLTSKKILRSEASNRFEKGLSPDRTKQAMERASYLLNKYCDGQISSKTSIYNNLKDVNREIKIKVDDIGNLLGIKISKKEIIDILKRLSFDVVEDKDNLIVTPPERRIDISIKEDIIEEVARIYGIDKIEGTLPVLPVKEGSYNKLERALRDKISSLGFNETLSYTLIPQSESHKFTTEEFEEINLLDPMSDDHTTLRNSLLPSLMLTYDYNSKRNNKNLSLFEIGKSFKKVNGEFVEKKSIAFLMSGLYKEGLYKEKVTFYHLKGVMEEILDYLGFNNRYSLKVDDIPKELSPTSSASIILNGKKIGIIGKVHPKLTKEDIYLMEMDLEELENLNVSRLSYQEISKYPSISKDVAFIISKDITNEEIKKEIKKSIGKYLTNIVLFDMYDFGNNEVSLAYNLTFSSNDNTLTDDIVMPLFNKCIEDITKKFNCQLRDK